MNKYFKRLTWTDTNTIFYFNKSPVGKIHIPKEGLLNLSKVVGYDLKENTNINFDIDINKLKNYFNEILMHYNLFEIISKIKKDNYEKFLNEDFITSGHLQIVKTHSKNGLDKRLYLEFDEESKKIINNFLSGVTRIVFESKDGKNIFYPEFDENYKELLKPKLEEYYKEVFNICNIGDNSFKSIEDPIEENEEDNEQNNKYGLKTVPTSTIQTIYYGAPGTGKSYMVSKKIGNYYDENEIAEKDNPHIIRTTIYQDYSYYDFIGNLMPKQDGENLKYEFKPGSFTIALTKAFENPDMPIFLVVEEMSRGNIASIFGDIFQLLDRKEGVSEYSIKNTVVAKYILNNSHISNKTLENGDIYLPENLHIIGTVNTSDQNVNVIDTAFKRRFSFEYTSVAPVRDEDGIIDTSLNNFTFTLGNQTYEWLKLYMVLNKFIINELKLNEDKQLGQFFIKFEKEEKENYKEIQNKLLHYLWDDVQSASIDENISIFDKEIKTFSKLYKKFNNKENIFSEKLNSMYVAISDVSILDESFL